MTILETPEEYAARYKAETIESFRRTGASEEVINNILEEWDKYWAPLGSYPMWGTRELTFDDVMRLSRRSAGGYNPRGETARILDRGLELVQSVPYRVSARWVFYRLLQEGYYSKKSDYKDKWCKISSAARHAFYNGWRPDTLSDETREAIIRGRGFDSAEEYLQALAEQAECELDKWSGQKWYLELWYEARAMSDQFRHYTDHVTLRPMGGQPSIPYKWEIAKDLERVYERYKLPMAVLYFGDLDTYGDAISDAVESDVKKWCSSKFRFVRCGLTLEQVQEYGVPENPEKPGEYQWEALSDYGASEIITSNVERYLRLDAFTEIEEQEREITDKLRGELAALAAKWGNDE